MGISALLTPRMCLNVCADGVPGAYCRQSSRSRQTIGTNKDVAPWGSAVDGTALLYFSWNRKSTHISDGGIDRIMITTSAAVCTR